MKDLKKLLALVLTLCMVMTLLPVAAFADAEKEPVVFPTAEEKDYALNIVNDSNGLAKYKITVDNLSDERVLQAGETLTVGINNGEKYSVEFVQSSPYYKQTAFSTKFVSGEVEVDDFGKTWSHTLGDDIDTGEYIYTYYDQRGSEISEDQFKSYNNGVKFDYVDGTLAEWTAGFSNDKCTLKSGKTTISKSKEADCEAEALKQYEKANSGALYKVADGAVYDAGDGCTDPTYKGVYCIYNEATSKKEPVKLDCHAADVTLTFTTVLESLGDASVEVNLLNNERCNSLDKTINSGFLVELMESGVLTKLDSNDIVGSVSALLNAEFTTDLAKPLGLDNMPLGSVISIDEKDTGNGFYEGLHYEAELQGTRLMQIELLDRLEEAAGLLWWLAGSTVTKMLGNLSTVTLPVSIGGTYMASGLRQGSYTVTITPPGDGWVAEKSYTYDITVSAGKTVKVGEQKKLVKIDVATLLDSDMVSSALGDYAWVAGCIGDGIKFQFIQETGVWFNHKTNTMSFTKVDTKGQPVEGAVFELVNRDQLIGLTGGLISLGKDLINSIVGGIDFDELVAINKAAEEGEGEIKVSEKTTDELLYSAIVLDDKLPGINIPDILEAKSDANGLVYFDQYSNVSIQKLTELIPAVYGLVENVIGGINTIKDKTSGVTDAFGKLANAVKLPEKKAAPAPEAVAAAEPGAGTKEYDEQVLSEPAEEASGSLIPDVNIPGLDVGISSDTLIELISIIGSRDQIKGIFDLLEQIGNYNGDFDLGGLTPATPTEPTEPTEPEPSEPTEPEPELTQIQLIMKLLEQFGNHELGYAALNIFGLMDGRFPTGNYVLLEVSAPEGYVRNPAMYTVTSTWDAQKETYGAYAQLGVVLPLIASHFTEFSEGIAAVSANVREAFGVMAGYGDKGLEIFRYFMDSIDTWVAPAPVEEAPEQAEEPEQTEETEQVEQPAPEQQMTEAEAVDTFSPKAAVIAYAAKVVYNLPGATAIFDTPEAVADVLLAMLDNKGYTFTSLLEAVDKLMAECKTMCSGTLDATWYYYNFSDDLFANAVDMFNYVLNKLLPSELAEALISGLADEMEAADEAFNEFTDKVDELITEKGEEIASALEQAAQNTEEKVDELLENTEELINGTAEAITEVKELVEEAAEEPEQPAEEQPVENAEAPAEVSNSGKTKTSGLSSLFSGLKKLF